LQPISALLPENTYFLIGARDKTAYKAAPEVSQEARLPETISQANNLEAASPVN